MDVDLDSKTSILNIAGFHFFIDKKTKSLPDFTPEIKQALSDNSLKHHMCWAWAVRWSMAMQQEPIYWRYLPCKSSWLDSMKDLSYVQQSGVGTYNILACVWPNHLVKPIYKLWCNQTMTWFMMLFNHVSFHDSKWMKKQANQDEKPWIPAPAGYFQTPAQHARRGAVVAAPEDCNGRGWTQWKWCCKQSNGIMMEIWYHIPMMDNIYYIKWGVNELTT